MADETITIQQAMAILKRSEKRVRAYIKSGRLSATIGDDSKYHIIKRDVEQLARHPDQLKVDKVTRQLSEIEQRLAAIEKRLDALESKSASIVQTPAQAAPAPRRNFEHSEVLASAIAVERPPGTITLTELALRVERSEGTIKGHLRKWDHAPERYPQFEHVRVPIEARPGQYHRYFTDEQVETISSWIGANTK